MSEFSLDKINQAVATTEAEVKVAEDTANKVTEAVMFSEKAQSVLQKTKPERKRRTLLAKLKPDLDAAESCLAKARLHEVATVRTEVWKALIGQIISGPVASKKDAEEIVSRLTSGGYLIQKPEGTLTILGKSYIVSPDSLFEKEDLADVKKKWNGEPKTNESLGSPGFRDRVKAAIRESSSESVPDLMAGKENVYRIFVPPQPPRNGTKIWLAGGLLLIESKKQIVEPLDIIGGDKIEDIVAQMVKLGVRCTARELHWDEPPRPDCNADKTMIEKDRKTRAFFYMVKRGVKFYVWHAKVKRAENLTTEEFFLEGKAGKHLVDNEEEWQNTTSDNTLTDRVKWVSRPVFLIERLEEDGENFFQIRELPDYLEALLAGCHERYPDTKDFAAVPQPLRQILIEKYNSAATNEGKMTLMAVDKVVESMMSATEPEPAQTK